MAKKGPMKNMIAYMATDEHKAKLQTLCKANRRNQSDFLRLLVEAAYTEMVRSRQEVRVGNLAVMDLPISEASAEMRRMTDDAGAYAAWNVEGDGPTS